MVEIHAGDTVTIEHTTGQATPTPKTEIVTGIVYRDDEGTLRVNGAVWSVNLTRDADGYFPRGVVLISHSPAGAEVAPVEEFPVENTGLLAYVEAMKAEQAEAEAEAPAAEVAPAREVVMIGPKGAGRAYTVLGRTEATNGRTRIWLARHSRGPVVTAISKDGVVRRNAALGSVHPADLPEQVREALAAL
jgi:hypothetical protein